MTTAQPSAEPEFSYDAEQDRYVVGVDGRRAGFTAAIPQPDGTILFNHTIIDDEFQGQGLSSKLIKYALDDVRANGNKIHATCSAVLHFLEKDPEYQDLVA